VGFKVIHGIVDSLWVYREGASDEDYQILAKRIEENLGLPVSYEGRYKWIVFPPSKTNPLKPVNNRYFGVFVDGRIRYRGIEARRRDTPKIVKDMQLEMLRELAEASNPSELREKAVECVEIYRRYVRRIILGEVSPEDLAITRVLSMDPDNYSMKLRHVLAAKSLERMGARMAPGQAVTYILTKSGASTLQLLKGFFYDSEAYIRLLEKSRKDPTETLT